MRISDWSSDVCSSDLGVLGCGGNEGRRIAEHVGPEHIVDSSCRSGDDACSVRSSPCEECHRNPSPIGEREEADAAGVARMGARLIFYSRSRWQTAPDPVSPVAATTYPVQHNPPTHLSQRLTIHNHTNQSTHHR